MARLDTIECRDALAALPEIPEKLSIARRLIDHWLESKKTP